MAAWVAKKLCLCRHINVKPLFLHEAWATQARGVLLMPTNFLLLLVGLLGFGLGLIITITALFNDFSANGIVYRGVLMMLMGAVILTIRHRRTRGPKNTIRRSSR